MAGRHGRRFGGVVVTTALLAGAVVIAGAVPAGAASNVWSVATSPNTATGRDFLASVSCVSSTFCMAVGFDRDASTTPESDYTLTEMWDGTSWSIVPSPSPTNTRQPSTPVDQLLGVSCASETFCMAVGSGSGFALGLIWNGSTWRSGALPSNPASNPVYNSVSCTSLLFCVAVGSIYNPFTTHTYATGATWDGDTWAGETRPIVGYNSTFTSVSCSADSSCVAVGNYTDTAARSSYHTLIESTSNASTWTVATSPDAGFDNNLISVSCTSSTSCVAVGSFSGTDPSATNTLVENFDGTNWSPTAAPQPDHRVLTGVSCDSPTDCVAVGVYGGGFIDGLPVSLQTVAETWDGTAWSITPTPNPVTGENLAGVSCVDALNCTAVGDAVDITPPETTFIIAGTEAAVPDAPTGVSAGAGFRSATVTWTAPDRDNGSPITQYTITSWPGGNSTTVAAPQTTATVDRLATGIPYTFTVSATSANGTSAQSSESLPVTPVPGISIGDSSTLEGDIGSHTVSFPVTLSQPATTTVSVAYTVTGITATGAKKHSTGVDFQDKSGTVTFTPNAKTGKTPVEKTISVTVYGDTTVEADETFNVTLSNPTGGYLSGHNPGTGTIVNDDGVLTGTTMGIGDASIVMADSSPTTMTLPVTLSAPTAGSVSVQYAVAPGTAAYSKKALLGGDYGGATTGTVTFAAGSTAKTIGIPIWPDATPDTDETFTVTLSGVTGTGVTMIRSVGTGTILSR